VRQAIRGASAVWIRWIPGDSLRGRVGMALTTRIDGYRNTIDAVAWRLRRRCPRCRVLGDDPREREKRPREFAHCARGPANECRSRNAKRGRRKRRGSFSLRAV